MATTSCDSMAPIDQDGAAVRFPPPLVYLIAVIAGALLHSFVFPLTLELGLSIKISLGLVVALFGLAIGGNAFRLFRQTKQDPAPWKSTPEIVSTGIFRFTRNPMYVGMALIQVGIGLALGNVWILTLTPVSLAVVYFTAVRHEEAYLERKFGQSYLAYKASVRRWL